MTQKIDFEQMSRSELRAYVLAHRSDEQALRLYMERLRNEPGVSRQTGGLDDTTWKVNHEESSRYGL
jgi:hypothetical protein